MQQLQRVTFRDQVREVILKMMLQRELKPGDKLSLASISRILGVSVTPIREALTQLEYAQIIEVIPSRGFFLSSLSIQEAENLYPIIASMESMMVKSALPTTNAYLKKISSLVDQFEKAVEPVKKVEIDMKLHQAIVSRSSNTIAARILEDLKIRSFFYELQYMINFNFTSKSEKCHMEILEALQAGDRNLAARLLATHWEDSLSFIQQHSEILDQ